MLHKVKFDKKTVNLDPDEERYWMHALKGDPLIGPYIRNQMRHNPDLRDIAAHPVCIRCEKFSFHHKGGVMCPSCGYFNPVKTHDIKAHIRGGHFK